MLLGSSGALDRRTGYGVGSCRTQMLSNKTRLISHITPLRLVLFCVVMWIAYYVTPAWKAVHWLTLDLPKFNRMVDKHMREFHGTAEYACVYTVNCATGEALLQLRTSLTQAELDTVKKTVWRRRFENYCPGRTTNFGIENSGEAEYLHRPGWERYRRRDIWFDGDFVGEDGNFWGGSFAPPGGWTPCTRDNAYWTRDDGIISKKVSD